jgi:hypothetical protein
MAATKLQKGGFVSEGAVNNFTNDMYAKLSKVSRTRIRLALNSQIEIAPLIPSALDSPRGDCAAAPRPSGYRPRHTHYLMGEPLSVTKVSLTVASAGSTSLETGVKPTSIESVAG